MEHHDGKVEFKFDNGRFSFVSREGGEPFGWSGFSFRINGISSTGLDWKISPPVENDRKVGITATADIPDSPLTDTLDFSIDAQLATLVVKRVVACREDSDIHSVEDGMLDTVGTVLVPAKNRQLRFCHSSNIRTEDYPRSRPEYPYVARPPYGQREYNIGEANDIPAYYLCDEAYKRGMLEAVLREDVFKRVWRMEIDPRMMKSEYVTFQAVQEIRGSDVIPLAAGSSIVVSETLYQLLWDTHPQHAFDHYLAVFSSIFRNHGAMSPMLHGACYCSWNYGPTHNVTEGQLLERAKIIRDRFPAVNFFLLDDGYERPPRDGAGTICRFYPDPENNFNPEKFPSGMRGFADKIRAKGLTPAIWMNPQVRLDSELAANHPDWLLRSRDGTTFHLEKKSSYLDLSVKPAREWMLKVLNTLFVKWGFKGLKLDFQSHMFESRDALTHSGTLIQWRNWFYAKIREFVGDDGFFETCIAMSMGNPHISRYADAYRLGADVNDGFDEHRYSSSWSLAALPIRGRDSMLPNMDSFGFDTEYSQDEFESRMAWCFITQGMLEFGGRIEEFGEHRVEYMRRILEHPDRGHGCEVLDQGCYTGEPFPQIVYVIYPPESITAARGIIRHIALFNWFEEPQMTGATHAQLGLDGTEIVRDFWTDELFASSATGGIYNLLAPHACRLLSIIKRLP
ncbi:MAG: alpha-galactosidase [Victivallales bacterium]|nr:alpha-galactosidase [Victivallales bacterium]